MIQLQKCWKTISAAVAGLTVLLSGALVHASEADLKVPDLTQVTFLGTLNGRSLLLRQVVSVRDADELRGA